MIGGRLCVRIGGRLLWSLGGGSSSLSVSLGCFLLSSLAGRSTMQSNMAMMSSTSEVSSCRWRSRLSSLRRVACRSFFFLHEKMWFSTRNLPSFLIAGSLLWERSCWVDSGLHTSMRPQDINNICDGLGKPLTCCCLTYSQKTKEIMLFLSIAHL